MTSETGAGRILILLLLINIGLTLNVPEFSVLTSTKQEGNVAGSLFNFNSDLNVENINGTFSDNVVGIAGSGTATAGTFEGFTNTPGSVTGVLNFLFTAASAPLQLLFNTKLEMPLEARLMFGLPLTIAWLFALISFFRKGD